VEQVGQLAAFTQAYLSYAQVMVATLENLSAVLSEKYISPLIFFILLKKSFSISLIQSLMP
jgi:hypothetical protein